jgi:ferritin-like metal-binding protein YciE
MQMQNGALDKLYLDLLKDTYSAEKQLVRALPKLAKAANSDELRTAIENHLEVTRGHVERLEQVFDQMGKTAAGKTCKGMQGLLEEGQEFMEEDLDPSAMDAGLIANAQKVEHYEIAAYGTLRSLAQTQGDDEAARLFEQTLEEEYEADKRLSSIAESSINMRAMAEDEENMDEAEEDTSNGRSSRGSATRGKRARTSKR